MTALEVTDRLVTRAGELATTQALCGYDAVHLASFEEIAESDGVLVAADGALLGAAARRGFTTVPLAA